MPLSTDEMPTYTPDTSKRWPLVAVLLGGGFAVGLICGVAIFARNRAPAETPTASNKFETAERKQHSGGHVASAEVAAAKPSHTDQQALESERRRLEEQLETLKLKQEIAALRSQLGETGTSPVSTTLKRSGEVAPAEPQTVTGPATLQYWNRMNDVIVKETQMRSAPRGGVDAGNAGGFLQARIDAAQYAAAALRGLDTNGVDPEAIEVAELVAGWYDEGEQVAETGRQLLTSGSVQARKGAAGQQYQAAEMAHAKAVAEVNSRGEQVRQQLAARYGISFPPLK